MYKDILKSIAGIEIYPLFSFIVFFAFFVLLLVYVVSANKDHIKAMAKLPLNNEENPDQHTQKGMWS